MRCFLESSMPLCIVSGRPFSGKTHLSGQLKTFLEARPDKPYENVILISDEDSYAELNLPRDQVYESTHVLEKRLRGNLKAETEKALGAGWLAARGWAYCSLFFLGKAQQTEFANVTDRRARKAGAQEK